ncbi:hypothetical protein SDC9_88003 [bioreactor metagenome]|uniref:Uncharacterized protein n=1 Tax=bioreactor metagenome TaxID=1076179 RepID=A0A644ZLV8_9ZZZZ
MIIGHRPVRPRLTGYRAIRTQRDLVGHSGRPGRACRNRTPGTGLGLRAGAGAQCATPVAAVSVGRVGCAADGQ